MRPKRFFQLLATAAVYFLLFCLLPGTVYGSDLSVDEVINAIKKEIQSAGAVEAANPTFEITSVDVSLSVFVTEDKRGNLAIRVPGFYYEDIDKSLVNTPYNKLNFSFKPTGSFVSSQEASMGLVEPIKRIKTLLRSAYTSQPQFQMNNITFGVEFAIERSSDGGINFQVLQLNDLKSINVATHKITIYFNIR